MKIYETFVRNRYKALAPDFGIDLVTVVRHCCYARRRAFRRSLAFCGIGLLLAYVLLSSELPPTLLGLALAALFATSFIYRWSTFSLICKHFSRQPLDSSFLPPLPNRLAHLNERSGNLTVYSGFSPFVGSGVAMREWSFVADTRKGKRLPDGQCDVPRAFTTPELYEVVSHALGRLGLSGLSIEDRVHVNGQDVRHDPRFFDEEAERPRAGVAPEIVKEFMTATGPQAARHYRCARVVDWNGELVVSFFLRIVISANALFVETNSHLLTPINDAYRHLEHVHKSKTVLQVLIRLSVSLVTTIPLLIWAPFNLAERALRPLLDFFRHLVQDWIIRERPLYEFGATQSARELAAGFSTHRRYSIRQDGEMLSKTLETCVLDSVIDFLDARNIDTSGIKERGIAILNSGVFISGGTIKAESLAIGKGSKSLVGRMVRKVKAVRAAAA